MTDPLTTTNTPEEARSTQTTCSARFNYDADNGFVYDAIEAVWLTNYELLFRSMSEEVNRLTVRLRDIANMPEYDQDDAHRLRHMALAALPNAKLRDAAQAQSRPPQAPSDCALPHEQEAALPPATGSACLGGSEGSGLEGGAK